MPKVVYVLFFIIAGIVLLGQIGACNECSNSGGVYGKTWYGTYECFKR